MIVTVAYCCICCVINWLVTLGIIFILINVYLLLIKALFIFNIYFCLINEYNI